MSKRALIITALAAIPVLLGALLLSGITFRLDFLHSRFESLAADLLDRKVSIRGPVRLTASLNPSLHLGGLTISNPHDWPAAEDAFLAVEEARAQLSLVKLVQGDFHLLNLEFTGVDLNLITRADQSTNYRFDTPKAADGAAPNGHELSSLDRLSLEDLRLSYIDAFSGRRYTLVIDQAHGTGMVGQPLHFSMTGSVSGTPCSLDLTGGTLQELLAGSPGWTIKEGRLKLADTALELSGSVNPGGHERAGYLNLALNGRGLDAIGTVFDLSLPDIGEFYIGAGVTAQPGMLQFTGLKVQALDNSLEGEFILSLTGERPALAGNLSVDLQDPGSLAALADSSPSGASQPPPPDPPALPWEMLSVVDTDLRLRVADLALGAVQIEDMSGVISIVDGDLVMPLSLVVMDVPLSAQLDIAASQAQPPLNLAVSSPGADLTTLLDGFSENRPLNGRLGPVSITASTSGNTPAELFDQLDSSVLLGPTALRSGQELLFSAESAALTSMHDESLAITAAGQLLGSPLRIDYRFTAGEQPGPSLSMQIQACETDLLVDGATEEAGNGSSTFSIELEGRSLCGLMAPVDQFLGETADFSLQTSGSLDPGTLQLDIDMLRLGQIQLNGHAELTSDEGDTPRFSGEIFAEKIDLVEILDRSSTDRLPKPDASAAQNTATPAQSPAADPALDEKLALLNKFLTMELLPLKGFLKTDVELTIVVDELHSDWLDIADINFTVATEKGVLKHSPFQARIGGSTFTGSTTVDVSASPPQAHFELTTEDFILAELLRDFELETVPDVSAGSVEFDVSLEGRTVKDMLLQAGHIYRLRDGRIVLPRKTLIPLVVAFDAIDLVVEPGQPSIFALDGDINSRKLAVDISTDGFINRGADKPITVELQAALGDTRLEVDGLIKRRIEKDGPLETFHLSTTLSGDSMAELNELFGMNMPPLGPYLTEGTIGFGGEDKLVRFYDMGLLVGDSSLVGELSLQFSNDEQGEYGFHTDFDARLEAETIQLNDFKLDGWSAISGTAPVAVDDQTAPESGDRAKNQFNLVSADLAKQIDGTVDIEVREVLSGSDQLGRGALSGRMQDGLYVLEKLELDIPGGRVEITGSIEPTPDNIRAALFMNVKQFDYGIMARRVQPDSSLKGNVNLLLDLEAAAPDPLQLREHLNGRFKFGIVPEEYHAGVLDLWAANIITAALPALLKGSSSVINCLAGDFTVESGLMQPELFLMDTSKIRVQGKGSVDLRTNTIDFHMKPTPKSASFFSLATPISVTGTIFSPDIGVTAGGIVQTVFRQAASLVTVPFQWLFSKKMEEDGAEVCGEAMRWAELDDFK